MDIINVIFMRAVQYDSDNPLRIQHFTKVHDFSRQIAIAENISPQSLKILEITAILHDVGIRASLEKYGDDDGKHQEELGPDIARRLLKDRELTAEEIDRICYLIGHHHTYTGIDGLDYQILVEADFLVNIYESHYNRESIQHVYDTVFQTKTGKEICRLMFGI